MLLLASALGANQIFYVIPLVVAVSLVYGATRHEWVRPILQHALRTTFWMLTFIGSIFLVLLVLDWWLN